MFDEIFEELMVPLICHVVDLIKNGTIFGKTYLQFAFELTEVKYR